MNNALKKIYLVVTGLLIAATAPVNGSDYAPSRHSRSNSSNAHNNEFNVEAELLYWKPELGGLNSAFGKTTIGTTVNGSIITTTVTESDEDPKFKWNTGFRIGANASYDCFDVEADWTHFTGGATFRDGRQHGRWKIRYDVIDLTIGRSFCVGSCFYLEPFIGIRGARIHQTLKSDLETLFTSSLIGNNIVTSRQDNTEDFWGIGPEIGLEVTWDLGCNLSLYGSVDLVTYYGRVRGRSYSMDSFTATDSIGHGKSRHSFNSAATDLALGIRWDKTYCCSCYEMNFMLRLGVEQHRIYDFSDLGSDGTLSLDGGVFGAGIGITY